MAQPIKVSSMGPNTVEQSIPHVSTKDLEGATLINQHGGLDSMGICASPAARSQKRKSKLKKDQSALARTCRWVVDHQIGISVTFAATVITSHLFVPSLRWETEKFFSLNYYNPQTGRYGVGWDDMFFVLWWIGIFTGARVTFMSYIAAPFAKFARIENPKDQVRFAEQAWIFLYDGSFWTLGIYIMYNSEYWLNLPQMWAGWPDREMDGLFKWYYLVQFAFWLQQIVVVNIEERRKDHWQMFIHHIVTSCLMFSSYAYHAARVGNVILCLMDFVDIILPAAKMLKYAGFQFACDCAFGLFIVGWIVTRHVLYAIVMRSIHYDTPHVIEYGCYSGTNGNITGPVDPPAGFWYLLEPLRDPQGRVCITAPMINSFLALLACLQVIIMIWFGMIMRLAYRVISSGGAADDPRSDDEEEEEEEEEERETYVQEKHNMKGANGYAQVPADALEEEVGVEQLHFRSRPPGRSKNSTRTTSVQLPVKKELLNRVGCDTKTSK